MVRTALRLLAAWPYERTSWVQPVERLARDHGFDVTYVAYRDAAEEPSTACIPADRSRVHWRDHPSGRALLRAVRPDVILQMGLHGAWSAGLRAAAHDASIPTAFLAHGHLVRMAGDPMSNPGAWQPRHVTPGRVAAALPAIAYVMRSHGPRPLRTLGALRAILGPGRAVPPPRPDRYLLPGRHDLAALERLDSDARARTALVGLPEHDPLHRSMPPEPSDRQVLLIDTPHTGGPHNRVALPASEKAAILRRLAADLAVADWRLRVKLHPGSYGDTWPDTITTIDVVREADLAELLRSAAFVVGFDSSLMVPALRHRPGAFVDVTGETGWLVPAARDAGVPVLSGYAELTAQHVLAAAARDDAAARRRFVEDVLAVADGTSLAQVAEELRRLAVGS